MAALTKRDATVPEFVTFHADRPSESFGAHPNANLASSEYMEMIDLLCRSARIFHPGAECTLLTDKATRVTGLSGPINRVDSTIDHKALMLSRTLAQADYLAKSTFSRPMAFVDSDILVNASLARVFKVDFDVALTWRINKAMPINGGLMLLNNRRPERVRAFFQRFVSIYLEHYANESGWFGDQLALRDVVGLSHRVLSKSKLIDSGGVRVLMLPCDTHNFSPDNLYAEIATPLADKAILHFKGPRKRLMAPFWCAHLRHRESFLGAFLPARLKGSRALRHLIAKEAADGASLPQAHEE